MAATFLTELKSLQKIRIKLTEVQQAYIRARPEAANSSDMRSQLLIALRQLRDDGAVRLPKQGWESTGYPELPKTIELLGVAPKSNIREPYSWLPELDFAADETNQKKLVHLKQINAFLLSAKEANYPAVPTKERSLHIFNDEKKLDEIRKGNLTFYDGKISLQQLLCYPVSPPLHYETYSSPKDVELPILVLENYHSYHSFCKWNKVHGSYAAVAYGGGNSILQSAQALNNIKSSCSASGVVYVGDVDPTGIEILISANNRSLSDGFSGVKPHLDIYKWLLENGYRTPLKKKPAETLTGDMKQLFPADLIDSMYALWKQGYVIPQESFGLQELLQTGNSITTA